MNDTAREQVPPKEMKARVAAFDWSATPLGPAPQWPVALKTMVGMLLESNHPMLLWWGPELIQIYNDAYRQTMGPERHPKALGQPGRECWEEIWTIIGPQIDSVMAGGPAIWQVDQLVALTRDGRRQDLWWDYCYSAIPDQQQVAGVLVVCSDVTEAHLSREEQGRLNQQLSAEIARRRFEYERQKTMFEQAPGFMCILRGPEHVFEFANDAYVRLLGGRDPLGKSVAEAIPEVANQGFMEILDRVYSTATPFFAQNLSIMLQGQADSPLVERILDFIYQPIIEADGSCSGIFVQGNDVTKRKGAEDELLAANRRKDEFLAMLAHELRNPLAPISAAAQLLQRAQGDATARMAGDVIQRQVRHMTSLVDDLLDAARFSRGQVAIDRQSVEVAKVVAEAIEQVRPLIESHRHRLEVRQSTQALLVHGDHKRLVQVLANLLSNAAKFTPSGGTVTVAVEGDAAADRVFLSVRDTGHGIDAELLPRVFDLFSQGARSLDRAQGGLGIGLALARDIVELHGGTLSARSAGAGQGAEFTVALSQHHAAGTALPAAAGLSRPAGARRTRRVLVVDDNLDAATTLSLFLEAEGHAVRVEQDPMAALAQAGSDPADVYLLDIGLPDLDGNELARRIRNSTQGRGALIVAISGYGQEADRQAALAAGFDNYFVKPVDLDELLALLAG
jgi:signal transduction histidine kinase/CheY-like chemotaxis protein